jgi:hypothetical protein
LSSTSVSAIPAYGMQRETFRRAAADADGHPQVPYNLPVYDSWLIHGELDPQLLCRAAGAVLDETDVLRGRLRSTPSGPLFVEEPGRSGCPVLFSDLEGCRANRAERLGHVLFHAWSGIRDLQHGPLGTAVVVRLGPTEHVLSLAMDHSISDHTSLNLLLKRMGRVYGALAEGDDLGTAAAARLPGFFPHARNATSDARAVEEARLYWKEAVAVRPAPYAFPGGSWLPWRERRVSEYSNRRLSPQEMRTLRTACTHSGTSVAQVYLAAITLVLSGTTGEDFLPVTYNRTGRSPSATRVPGPLAEMVVSSRSPEEPPRIGDWVGAFARTNTGAPATCGSAMVDYAALDHVMELRRVTLNVLHAPSSFRFGRLTAQPLPDDAITAPRVHQIHGTAHSVGVKLTSDNQGMSLACQYDPRDLPDSAGFLRAVHRVVERAAETPDGQVRHVRAEAGEIARG